MDYVGLNYTDTPIIELLLYIFGLIVIVISTFNGLIRSVRRLINPTKQNEKVISDLRIYLSESYTLALTFILGAEIMKIFRIPNNYQLIRVTLLVLLRQLIVYFLDSDIIKLKKEIF